MEQDTDEKNMEKLLKSAEVRLVLDALVDEHEKMLRLRQRFFRKLTWYPIALAQLVAIHCLSLMEGDYIMLFVSALAGSLTVDVFMFHKKMGILLRGTTACLVTEHRKTLTEKY